MLPTALSPELSSGMTLATVFQKNSENVIFFFTKFYIVVLKGKASNKKVFILETKLSLSPSHAYNLFVSGHLLLWFSVSVYHYEPLNFETVFNDGLRVRAT